MMGSQSTKKQRGEARQRLDVFADLREATEEITSETPAGSGGFVEAFSKTVTLSSASTLAERLAQEYGFKASKEQSFDIPIDRVLSSPDQMREDRSRWTEKQEREYGRLKKAIQEGLNEVFFVAQYPDRPGYFFLTYGGHNRRDAAREVGYTHIPCIIIDYDPTSQEDQEKVSFGTTFENEVKVPLTLEERGRHYASLMQRYGISQEKLAKRLDLSRDDIKNCIMIARSPEYIRSFVRDLEDGGGIRIARALNRLEQLRALLGNEEAPLLACTPLMRGYKQGEMKTDLIEAYVAEILCTAELSPTSPIENILQHAFQPPEQEEHRQQIDQPPQDKQVPTPDRPGEGMAPTSRSARSELESRSPKPLIPSPERQVAAPKTEHTHRLGKLLKVEEYLHQYHALAAGKSKSEQERRKLAEIHTQFLAELEEERSNQ